MPVQIRPRKMKLLGSGIALTLNMVRLPLDSGAQLAPPSLVKAKRSRILHPGNPVNPVDVVCCHPITDPVGPETFVAVTQ